jgi:hypothetical protein
MHLHFFVMYMIMIINIVLWITIAFSALDCQPGFSSKKNFQLSNKADDAMIGNLTLQ